MFFPLPRKSIQYHNMFTHGRHSDIINVSYDIKSNDYSYAELYEISIPRVYTAFIKTQLAESQVVIDLSLGALSEAS